MTAKRLKTHRVEKPWGRSRLWPGFADPAPGGEPVGEIWFQDEDEGAATPELLVKYLFTSERLSIQVHPDDDAARAAGHARGKDEAWVILDAEPGATIALGTKQPLDRETLRAAALDGSIEQLVDWKPVKAGDVVYSPAGTIHAIGAGITLVEVQQNVDLTYRLYDYGRPRELHLDAGIAISDARPFTPSFTPEAPSQQGRAILAQGGKFVLERWKIAGNFAINLPETTPGWFVPLTQSGLIEGDAQHWQAGETWLVGGMVRMTAADTADILFAYPGAEVIERLLTH